MPITPTLAPDMKKIRVIMPRDAPMVRMIAIEPRLSLTNMIIDETMLNAATRMISVKIRNMTFRSTCNALKKLEFFCFQSTA